MITPLLFHLFPAALNNNLFIPSTKTQWIQTTTVQYYQNDLSPLAYIKELNPWAPKAVETPPCFTDQYNFGRNIRRGWALQKTVHVNYQIDVSIDKQVAAVPECVWQRNGWLQACCQSPSRSRFQYFPSNVTPTFNYFQMIVVSTLSRSYITISWYQNFPDRFQYFPTHSTKTFQLSVPKLSNSQYQNFPTHSTKNFQI